MDKPKEDTLVNQILKNAYKYDVQIITNKPDGEVILKFTPNKNYKFESALDDIYMAILNRLIDNGYELTEDLMRNLRNDLRSELKKHVQ